MSDVHLPAAAPDYVQGLQSTIEAIQLIVPEISFVAGVSTYEVYAKVPDCNDSGDLHFRRLKRPAAISEALRSAFIGNLQGSSADKAAPAMTGLWLGSLSWAVMSVHQRFPHLELEFGYVGGLLWAQLRDNVPPFDVATVSKSPLCGLITLADVVEEVGEKYASPAKLRDFAIVA